MSIFKNSIITATLRSLAALALVFAALAGADASADDAKPKVINFGFANAGVGGRPAVGGGWVATVHARGLLEEEFKKDGIEVRWNFFTTAGPGVNEAISNGLLDFAFQGDLPSLIGKAGGLDTRVVMAGSRNGTFYIGATPSSGIQSVADLKGRKAGLFKGTALQLAAQHVLAANGLTESDLRTYNMDFAAGNSAIASGDIDALFGGSNLFGLRDQGLLRLIYDGRADGNKYGFESSVLVLSAFAKKYPEITYRVVKVFLQGAQWSALEENRDLQYKLWAKSGTPYTHFREDFRGLDFKEVFSPLLDEEFISEYKKSGEDTLKNRLIRKPVDVDAWFDPTYLNRALVELELEDFWPRRAPRP